MAPPTDLEEDIINLLDEKEALELAEFNPTVETLSTWDPTKGMLNFLEKHFNRWSTDDERTSILADFPVPNTSVLQAQGWMMM